MQGSSVEFSASRAFAVPRPRIALIVGIFIGGVYGGSRSAILLNIPGAPSSVATAFDGYPLAKGVFAAALGTVIGMVGMDPLTAQGRFTLDQVELMDGIHYAMVMIGLFGVAQSFYQLHNLDVAPAAQQDSAEDGPLYAVKVQPGCFGTFAGLKTNANAQVLNGAGQPIDGLYAASTDMASIMGGHYPAGGINLGPAVTFGYIAGRHIAGATATSEAQSRKTVAEHSVTGLFSSSHLSSALLLRLARRLLLFPLGQRQGLREGLAHVVQALFVQVVDALAALTAEVDQLVIGTHGYRYTWRKVRFRRGAQDLRVFAT
ncbi:hypothetical protein GCM10027514_43840 [Azotobacter armeniacus]